MDGRDKILLVAIAAFVLMAWGSAWVFTQVNGYPVQWYWLPIAVTACVASSLFCYAWLNRSQNK